LPVFEKPGGAGAPTIIIQMRLRPEFWLSPCHRSCHDPGTFLPLQHH
jgi:hypothetical protein